MLLGQKELYIRLYSSYKVISNGDVGLHVTCILRF